MNWLVCHLDRRTTMLDTTFTLARDEHGNMPYLHIASTTIRPCELLRSADAIKTALRSGGRWLLGTQLETGPDIANRQTLLDLEGDA